MNPNPTRNQEQIRLLEAARDAANAASNWPLAAVLSQQIAKLQLDQGPRILYDSSKIFEQLRSSGAIPYISYEDVFGPKAKHYENVRIPHLKSHRPAPSISMVGKDLVHIHLGWRGFMICFMITELIPGMRMVTLLVEFGKTKRMFIGDWFNL